jgi:hypothetical protein
MADIPESTPIEDASPEEIAEVILELEQYRERLIADTLSMAQKAKVMKSQAMTSLEPQLAEIDLQLQSLRQQQALLTRQL